MKRIKCVNLVMLNVWEVAMEERYVIPCPAVMGNCNTLIVGCRTLCKL